MGEFKTQGQEKQIIVQPKSTSYTHEKLESVRKNKGISITFMATKLGYKNSSSYKKVEQGQAKIEISQGMHIAELLNEDFYSLFFN